MKDISLSEKLILIFLLLGLSAIGIVGVFSFFSTKEALLDRTFDQLTSLRIVKRNQIESFFSDRCQEAMKMAKSPDICRMTERFATVTDTSSAHGQSVLHEMNRELAPDRSHFPISDGYFSRIFLFKNAETCIQIEQNPENSSGSFTIRYTALPINDLVKNLDTTEPSVVRVKDLTPTGAVSGSSLYLLTRIHDTEKAPDITFGILLEIPVSCINAIMLNNNSRSGLGTSGETYLVGKDRLMRSQSRFIQHSVLNTHVYSDAVSMVFSEGEGQTITRDYRGISVLSSFTPVAVPGLDWALMAEIDVAEAMIPIYHSRNMILLVSVILAIVFFIFVYFFSKKLTRPIIRLRNAVRQIGEGDYSTILPVSSNDEIGSLTVSFNKMTAQIKEKTDELRFERLGRLRSVIDAEETERQRLSREIHDGIGQSLIALKLRMEGLLYCNEKDMKSNIAILKDQFDATVDEIRRISNNLMPSVLEAFGITIALRNLCEETEEHSGIRVVYQCHDELEMLSTRVKTYLFRIAQEALNNVIKHSEASRVELTLARTGDFITFTIRDNGKGFPTDTAGLERGNGLHNMRERVALMTGTIEIVSSPESGISITITVPIY